MLSVRKPKTTLLLVDDDYQFRLLLSMVLTNQNYDVRLAEDGISALKKLRSGLPDILLSDLNMPGMSGFELLSIIRRRFPRMKSIAMSSAFSGTVVPPGVAADAFYQKGNDLDELLDVLRSMHAPEKVSRATMLERTTPVWIPEQEQDDSGRDFVTIHCPECLRPFRQATNGTSSLLQEATCSHCGGSVTFALVAQAQPAYFTPTSENSLPARKMH